MFFLLIDLEFFSSTNTFHMNIWLNNINQHSLVSAAEFTKLPPHHHWKGVILFQGFFQLLDHKEDVATKFPFMQLLPLHAVPLPRPGMLCQTKLKPKSWMTLRGPGPEKSPWERNVKKVTAAQDSWFRDPGGLKQPRFPWGEKVNVTSKER